MLEIILIGLNVGIFLLLMITLSKQFFTNHSNAQIEKNLKDQFNDLLKRSGHGKFDLI